MASFQKVSKMLISRHLAKGNQENIYWNMPNLLGLLGKLPEAKKAKKYKSPIARLIGMFPRRSVLFKWTSMKILLYFHESKGKKLKKHAFILNLSS